MRTTHQSCIARCRTVGFKQWPYTLCYKDKVTEARHRQEGKKRWHNPNHQQTNQAITQQPANNNINLCTNHLTHHTHQPALHPHEHRSHNAPAQYPASDPRSSKAKTKCPQQHSNHIAHAHAGTSNPQPSRHSLYTAQVSRRKIPNDCMVQWEINKAPPPYTGTAPWPHGRGKGGGWQG